MGNFLRSAKIAVIAVLVASAAGALFAARRDYTKTTQKLDAIVLTVLKDCGVSKKNFLYGKQVRGKSGGHTFLKIARRYEAAAGFNFDAFESKIGSALKMTAFKIFRTSSVKDEGREKHALSIAFKNRIIYEISFLKKKPARSAGHRRDAPKIAIVLDDFGYNMNNLGALCAISAPLTISVLPNLSYSKRVAREAEAKSIEVMLHLPLEPRSGGENIEAGTIKTGMPAKEVKDILQNALASVPGVKGVSNHMGSRATEDKGLMKVIFDELRRRRLYFMDNLTADDSICSTAAKEAGIAISARNVFLDNELDEGYIEKQVRRAAEIAGRSGQAVAVGHDRPATIRVLAKIIPELKSEGFQFVRLSELVK